MTGYEKFIVDDVCRNFNKLGEVIEANDKLESSVYSSAWKEIINANLMSARLLDNPRLISFYVFLSSLSYDSAVNIYSDLKKNIMLMLDKFYQALKDDNESEAVNIINGIISVFIHNSSQQPLIIAKQTEQAKKHDENMLRMFTEEAFDLLEKLANDLVELENTGIQDELINDIFRAVHTIKGNAAAFDFHDIKNLAHKMETVFSLFRQRSLEPSSEIIDILSEGAATLEKQIRSIRDNRPVDINLHDLFRDLDQLGTGTALTIVKNKAATAKESVPSTILIKNRSMRVDSGKMDNIVNLMGEVNINNNTMSLEFRTILDLLKKQRLMPDKHIDYLTTFIDIYNHLIDSLQKVIMDTRMMPLQGLFQRFPKLVRDLARQTGKEVVFEFSGGNIEVDKNILEEIADPLNHLLRNCVDHGIEEPDERKAKGKPPKGLIRLDAKLEGSQVLLSIEDDGRGMDKKKIIDKAVKQGIITPQKADNLMEKDIFEFIFQPGFSTKEVATEISGRGVGMDVVRQNLQKLKGMISINSTVNKGTKFFIALPASLAISEVLVVKEDIHTLGIPIEYVAEVKDITPEEIVVVENKEVYEYKNKLIPFFYMRNVLGVRSIGDYKAYKTIILKIFQDYLAICVDDIVRRQPIVMKPINDLVKSTRYINSGSIMSDGAILLIIDVLDIMRDVDKISVPVIKKKKTLSDKDLEKIYDVEDLISRKKQREEFIIISVFQEENKSFSFLVDVSRIYQIIDVIELSLVPEQPVYLAGYCSFLGQAVPVYDLPQSVKGRTDQKLGLKAMIFQKDDSFWGLLVHKVGKLIRVNKEDIKIIPDIGQAAESNLVRGIAVYEKVDFPVIDIDKLYQRMAQSKPTDLLMIS